MAEKHPDVTAGSTNKYQNWEVVDPEKWVPDGYACVRVDSRGAGRSPGFLDPWSPRETQDLAQCIAWAGTQPWSSGKVGLNGISYYAMNQWYVASLQPPHLAAMCVWEGAADFYRDVTHHGGILCTFAQNWYDMQVKTVQHGVGERGPRSRVTGELACGPETLPEDELAQQPRGLRRRHPRASARRRVPPQPLAGVGAHRRAVVLGGELGRPGPAPARQLRRLRARRVAARNGSKRTASSTGREFYTDYGVQAAEAVLRALPQGRGHAARLAARAAASAAPRPLRGARTRTRGRSRARSGRSCISIPKTRALRAGRAGRDGAHHVRLDAATASRSSAAPLEEDTEITGPLAARLFVSSRTTDADVFVVLRAFSPDGKEVVFQGAIDPHTPLAQGWLRASHRALDPELTTEYRPYHTHDDAAAARPRRTGAARRRAVADVDRAAARVPHRVHGARHRLRLSRAERRTALELQERAHRLRPVPARRPARPPGRNVRRVQRAARGRGPRALRALAGDPSSALGTLERVRAVVRAVAEQQRRLAFVGVAFHVAEEDLVVAAVVAVDDAAFEVRRRAVDQRDAVLAQAVRHAFELVFVRAREAQRELVLLRAEHVHAEVRRGAKRGQAGRVARQAPEHQRRVERHRAERVSGQPEEAALGVARRDDRDAGREGAERVAQVSRVERRGGGLVCRRTPPSS